MDYKKYFSFAFVNTSTAKSQRSKIVHFTKFKITIIVHEQFQANKSQSSNYQTQDRFFNRVKEILRK
jgi:hypothetical protein